MKELISKLKETVEFAERKINEANRLIEENNALQIKLKEIEKSHDERHENLSKREEYSNQVEDVLKAKSEIEFERGALQQEKLRLQAKEADLHSLVETKLKELSEEKALLKKHQEDLSKAQLQLSEDKKTYRQQVIDAVHKESLNRIVK